MDGRPVDVLPMLVGPEGLPVARLDCPFDIGPDFFGPGDAVGCPRETAAERLPVIEPGLALEIGWASDLRWGGAGGG